MLSKVDPLLGHLLDVRKRNLEGYVPVVNRNIRD